MTLYNAVKLSALLTIIFLTNQGLASRVQILLTHDRFGALAVFFLLWCLSLLCLLIVAFQQKLAPRFFWAVVFSGSTFASYAFVMVSDSQLSLYDVLSLWAAKHEAGRAFSQYAHIVGISSVISLATFVVVVVKPNSFGAKWDRALSYMKWTPVIPAALMVAILFLFAGRGMQALPQQYTPIAIGTVAVAKNFMQPISSREKVATEVQSEPAIRHIVYLVDESVRGDFVNLNSDNLLTPALYQHRQRIADFGQAASGSNCSHYTNAILRFGGKRDNLVESLHRGPTIWSYAKKAGFRTVYIDAQAPDNKISGRLQNFMTMPETMMIDEFITYPDVETPQLDMKILETVADLTSQDQPVFIYANKNGAHFPYDLSYPKSRKPFKQLVSDTNEGTEQERVLNSYKNSVQWSVGEFFNRLLGKIDLKDTAVIYTSDHGQTLVPGAMTHCSVENPDPFQGLVPMLVMTDQTKLLRNFKAAAQLNRNRSTHFAIFPTLLELFGYAPDWIGENYGDTLLVRNRQKPAFTSGDIFGQISPNVIWNTLSLPLPPVRTTSDKTRQTPGLSVLR